MIRGDDMRSPVERILGPGEPLAVYASNSAPPDPARSEEHGLKTTADRVDEHDRLRKPVVQHDLNPAIKIEGYLVPGSLTAPAIREPYWLAAPSRSMAGILVDFGSAAVVAAVVTLFATGQVPPLWNIGASGKAEQRSGDASTRAAPASSKLELSLPPLSQSSATATRPEPEVRMVASPAFAAATAAPPPDPALNQSPSTVLGASTDFNEADKSQPTTAAISPTESSARTSLPFGQFIIARELQGELKRVGCDPGNIDGDWNAASRRALENFNEHAGTNLDVEVANFSALSVVRSRMSRICPVACDRGSRVRGNRCLEVETQSVRRTADRNHMKRRRSTLSATRMAVGATTSRDARSEPARTNLR
jgi:hypothetical protein